MAPPRTTPTIRRTTSRPGSVGSSGGPDAGFGEDDESELVAEDVGIDGGAASAEEAAMHVIDDEDD